MRTIEVGSQAKLSELLDLVERGDDVFVTRQGKVVARIVPEPQRARQLDDVQDAIAAIEEFRKTMPKLSLEEILSARHEGHRR